MKELITKAKTENADKVIEFVNAELEALNCPMKAQTQIDIAIDEIFSNIANYAYNPEIGDAKVKVDITENPLSVIITFVDNGKPYNPLKNEDPNTNAKLDERDIGGLGIFMVKKMMDAVEYEYKDGQNILKIKKNI